MTTATVKETAAALRKHLRAEFPGTNFSVRMSTGTGYGWLRVAWEDGPTDESVREIARTYESSRFDGMDDSYHVTGNTQWSCCGVNTSRTYSAEVVAEAEALVQSDPGLARVGENEHSTARRLLADQAF